MTKRTLCFLLYLGLTTCGYCQQRRIYGILKDNNNKSISYAGVTLRTLYDSILVKESLSNQKGEFELTNIRAGDYILQIKSSGYKFFYKNISVKEEDINLNEISLVSDTVELSDVIIRSSSMPTIVRKLDKTIVNIENSVYSKGTNAYDLFNQIPEVQSDNIGNILFRGEGGVKLYVDGRRIQLSGIELMNYIKSIPSESIKSYELSSIRGAENDAENSGAIINIVLKNNYKYGFNGSVFSNYEENRYPVFSDGFLINYRVGKFAFQANYNYTNAKNFNDQVEEQQFYNPVATYRKTIFGVGTYISNYFKAGIDYNITNKQVISANYEMSSANTTWTSNAINTSYDTSNLVDSIFTTTNLQRKQLNNQLINIFYRNKFDSLGSRLDIGYAFIGYNNIQTSTILNQFLYPDSVPMRPAEPLYINNPLKINISTFNIDINKAFKNNANLKFGSKFEDSKTNNNILYYTGVQPNLSVDSNLSNNFIYDEKILAFYSSYSKEYKRLSLNIGLRTEYTDYQGKSIATTIQPIANNRWDVFPSVFLQRKLNSNNAVNFSYSRSISRPSYEVLNPFENIQDSKYIIEGNPFLIPYFTNSFELSYLLHSKYSFAFEYKRTTNEINNVFKSDGSSDNIVISTYANSNDLEDYTISASLPISITKWWAIRTYGNLRYKKITINYDTATHLVREKITPYIWVDNTFSIAKGYYIDVSGSFLYNAFYGIYDLEKQGSINISGRKSFFKDKLTLTLNSNDPFNLKRIRIDIDETTFHQKIENFLPTRTFSIGLSYHFSKGNKSTTRENIQSSNQEAKDRL